MKPKSLMLILLVMTGVAAGVVTLRAGAADTACPVHGCFTLAAPGTHVFWDGEYINSAQVLDPALCGTVGSPCFKYQLTVGEGGAQLRVGFDAVLQGFRSFADPNGLPPPGTRFRIQVRDSADNVHAQSCLYESDCDGMPTAYAGYSVEAFVPSPAAGVWTVVVIPTDVTDLSFRMRAKLELETQPAELPVRVLLPNMRIIPPYEPTFIAPAFPFGPPGAPGVSCMPEEIAEEGATGGATGCLRFSAGAQNNGDGWFGVHFFTNPPQPCAEPGAFRVFQRLQYSDPARVPKSLDCNGVDTPECRDGLGRLRVEAGCAALHPTHGHFHYEDIWHFMLFEVTDLSTGTPHLNRVGEGHKRGFDVSDEKLADWDRFYQGPRNYNDSGAGWFALTAGWGDVYEWNRSGQYVDFPGADGLYVIRGVVDMDDKVLESDETDNTGYALVFVRGEIVELCERGYGEDPWDPTKTVLPPSSVISSDALVTKVSSACAQALNPDLRVTNITTSNNRAREGEKVTITATIANAGSVPASASKTEFLLDGATVLGLVDTSSIPAGGTATVSVNWDTRSVKGEHAVRVTADKTALVAENDESNNAATLTISVKGNKLANGSFEQSNGSGTGPSGWSGSDTGAGTTSWGDCGSDGSRSVSMSGNGGSALLAGSPLWTSDGIAVAPAEVLSLVVSVRSIGASSPATAGLMYLDASGNVLGTVTVFNVPSTTAGFVTLEQLLSIPAGVSQVRVVLTGFAPSGAPTAGSVTFDDVGLFGS